MLEPRELILNQSHYLLYSMAAAMQPRWLLTLDEQLNTVPVTVRVGQAVDTVGKYFISGDKETTVHDGISNWVEIINET